MKIIDTVERFDGASSVVALGMFDGVHIGHQTLIRRAVALAHERGAECVVCTFDRHPMAVLFPGRAPQGDDIMNYRQLGFAGERVKRISDKFQIGRAHV